jgi:hypothetical protein
MTGFGAADRAARLVRFAARPDSLPGWAAFLFGFAGATVIGSSDCEFCAAAGLGASKQANSTPSGSAERNSHR